MGERSELIVRQQADLDLLIGRLVALSKSKDRRFGALARQLLKGVTY